LGLPDCSILKAKTDDKARITFILTESDQYSDISILFPRLRVRQTHFFRHLIFDLVFRQAFRSEINERQNVESTKDFQTNFQFKLKINVKFRVKKHLDVI